MVDRLIHYSPLRALKYVIVGRKNHNIVSSGF